MPLIKLSNHNLATLKFVSNTPKRNDYKIRVIDNIEIIKRNEKKYTFSSERTKSSFFPHSGSL